MISAEVVSKVISPNNSNTIFFKNVGINTPSLKTPSAGEQELDAEKQGATVPHVEVEDLKKRSEAVEEALERTQYSLMS